MTMESVKEKYCRYIDSAKGLEAYNAFKAWLYSSDDSLVQTLNCAHLQPAPVVRKRNLSFCDIGGGDGRRIRDILRFLRAKFHNAIHLDFVEQSQACVTAFSAQRPPDMETNVFHSRFEQTELRGGYDLVFLIHSIFAFEGGEALGRVFSLAKKGGTTIVVSNAADSFLGGLKRIVDEGYADRRYEVDSLTRDLAKQKISFAESTFKTSWGVPSEKFEIFRDTLLEWITLGAHLSFNHDMSDRVNDYLFAASHCIDDIMYFHEDEVVLTITNNSSDGDGNK